ncbi:TonB family protein [Erwinia sp. DT-104]|uniref:TonB family protein n=1 Tax=Erwinia sp. DT-104 TaxID=3396161 RepID=UPI003F19F922
MKSLLFLFAACVSFASFADNHGINYPERAERLRVTGHAKVLYDIGNDGRVSNIRFIEAEPRYVFEKEINKGMQRWTFTENFPRRDVSHEFTFAAR